MLSILLSIVIALILDVIIGLISLVVPLAIGQQTFDDIGNYILAISVLISLIVCVPFSLHTAKILKDKTWHEITRDSMLE
jgi:hypothetical protein